MNISRRATIRSILHEKPFVSIKELEKVFPEISSMTIRRDIDYFEKQGEAIKVRGGARSMKFITTSMEESFDDRMGESTNQKEAIAKCAAQFIENGQTVFLDSGTTAMALAESFPAKRCTVVTTGPNIALRLINYPLLIVNSVGGMLNRTSLSTSGSQAIKAIEGFDIDTAFLVPSGFCAKDGFTCGNYPECEFKQAVIKNARKVIILMDSSKVGAELPFSFNTFENIHAIITDKPLPENLARAADAAGVGVIIA